MIISELYRGRIFAGDTPLASTIVVEQSGPMQLTIRAGTITTTGQARVMVMETAGNFDNLVTEGRAEKIRDGKYRLWQSERNKARTMVLVSDFIWDIEAQVEPVVYAVSMAMDTAGVSQLVIHAMLPGEIGLPFPFEVADYQMIVFPFQVVGGMRQLPDIVVLTVEPGFPPGFDPGKYFQAGISALK